MPQRDPSTGRFMSGGGGGGSSGAIGDAFVEIGANDAQFRSQLGKSEAAFKKFGQSLVRIGRATTIAVTVPLVGFSAASVKAASDAEETESKFRTVFRSIGAEAEDTADTMAKAFGLSGTSARKLLGDTADLLSGFGFTQKAALDLAKDVNELAVDLASFTNVEGGAQRASQALTKALLGERESVKELGIAILEKDVLEKVAANTAKGVTFATQRQAKAFATLQLAQEQSKNAIGDFARTSDSLANRMKVMGETFKDLRIEWGRFLIDGLNLTEVVKKIIEKMRELREWIANLTPEQKKSLLIFVSMAAAIGPLLLVIGQLTIGIAAVGTAMAALGPALIPAAAALVGIGVAAFGVVKHFDVVSMTVKLMANNIKMALQVAWQTVKTWTHNVGQSFKNLFAGDFGTRGFADNTKEIDKIMEAHRKREEEILKARVKNNEEAADDILAAMQKVTEGGDVPDPTPTPKGKFQTSFIGLEERVKSASKLAFGAESSKDNEQKRTNQLLQEEQSIMKAINRHLESMDKHIMTMTEIEQEDDRALFA